VVRGTRSDEPTDLWSSRSVMAPSAVKLLGRTVAISPSSSPNPGEKINKKARPELVGLFFCAGSVLLGVRFDLEVSSVKNRGDDQGD